MQLLPKVALILMPALAAAQCVLQGNCGPASRFGNDLPCVNYTEPLNLLDGSARALLSQMCGAQLAESVVCCSPEQVQELSNNLKRVEPLLGSCPACQQNFFDVFCQFTCSPHQRNFVEIVANRTTLSGGAAPKELNYFVDNALAKRVYDSCRNVKFSATNGRALDLVGGGAQNYSDFFKFLGDEKPMLGGSAFQINFPWDDSQLPESFFRQNNSVGYSCNDSELGCSCIDCEESCPVPDDDSFGRIRESCKIGSLSCTSLGLVLGYTLIVIILAVVWVQARKSQRRQSALEIQRLIEDDEHDDDDPFSLPSTELGNLNLRSYRLNTWISTWLQRQGRFCAHYPWLVVALCALFVLCASLGLVGMQLESDPVSLWVAPDSREATERLVFNTEFDGGFYRTAQLFVVNETGPVLQDYETLEWLKSVEQRAAALRTPVLFDSLDSFCIKPVGDACVVESVTAYGVRNTPTWRTRLQGCIKQPVNCLPTFQQPIDPHLVFGQIDEEAPLSSFLDSPAMVTTWVMRNSEDPVYIHRAEEWEYELETFLRTNVTREAADRNLRVSFNVESSLQRELQRSGQTDAKIVVLSYLAMFAYVSLTLGDSIWLGLVGILVVVCSVTSTIGLLSLFGLRLTLIITEVIPFLALAIGVDNIFLIVHQLSLVNEVNPRLMTLEDQISSTIGSIGPSIVMSTSCEVAALAIATLVPMPAVHNFAIFACVAVFVNSVLQLTLFVSLLVLHKEKINGIHSLLRLSSSRSNTEPSAGAAGGHQNFNVTGFNVAVPQVPISASNSGNNSVSETLTSSSSPGMNSNYRGSVGSFNSIAGVRSNPVPPLASVPAYEVQGSQADPRKFSFIIGSRYTPFLLGRRVKQYVVSFFVIWLAFSLYALPQLSLGLDQRLAVPKDSFLVPYFSDVYDLLGVGPPVYFVVRFSEQSPAESRQVQQKMCGRFSTCEKESLANILEMERKIPDISWIATAPASWIDDFFMWLNPSLDTCCVEADGKTCYADKEWHFNMTGFPEDNAFTRYLNKWLSQPSDQCPLAGRAPYGQAISQSNDISTFEPNGFPNIGVSMDGGVIKAAYFRTNHVPLRSQQDYIDAFATSRLISDRITERTGLDVFGYSIFYPFFAQYLTVVSDSLMLVSLAIGITWLFGWLLLGNFRTATIVTGVVTSLVVDVCGLMYLMDISLNALSLVNLVICVGLAVEFCIHIARSFTFVPRVRAIGIRGFTKVDRAYNALAGTGGTVFGGVALTKLIGVCVLAFAHSQIFNVYYFRMWLALIVTASLHSMMLLPVVLSAWGGSAWLVEDEGAGLIDLEEL